MRSEDFAAVSVAGDQPALGDWAAFSMVAGPLPLCDDIEAHC